jgi:hypothetical protein
MMAKKKLKTYWQIIRVRVHRKATRLQEEIRLGTIHGNLGEI